MKTRLLILFATLSASLMPAQDTLPPLKDGKVPGSVSEAWQGYDPRKEPLDVEILKEWEEQGTVVKIIRLRVGIFKGKKAMLACVYGYPKGAKKLPGLVQIHGGGQFAHANAVLANAREGYATISIAWAGRLASSKYFVGNSEKQAFWNGRKDDPRYRITTDWGGVDAYHAPCRFPKSNFVTNPPCETTVDPVPSPRNSGWFLATMGARRAITFLERQPEVDKDRIGVYGHSMGGKLTVMVAGCDDRVKAAAPSCGGITDRSDRKDAFTPPHPALADNCYLQRITCPILFQSPTNDFHGAIQDLPRAIREIKSKRRRVVCSPYGNHQDKPEYEIASILWFNDVLKGEFKMPKTPVTRLRLKTPDRVPQFTVIPDRSLPVRAVCVYYTQQGDRKDNQRFWHYARPVETNGVWTAGLPLASIDRPLWVYADVTYRLNRKVHNAGYYYRINHTDTFHLASMLRQVEAAALKSAGVKPTLKRRTMIESFRPGWEREWFTYGPPDKALKCLKLTDPIYQPPPYAKLALEILSEKPNKIVVGLDTYAAEIQLKGGSEWQRVVLFPTDFVDAEGHQRIDWRGIKELRLTPVDRLLPGMGSRVKPKMIGAPWQGPKPKFRNLQWLPGTRAERDARRRVKLLRAPADKGQIFLDIKYADFHRDGWKTVMDTWLDGKPLVIDGVTYLNGLTTHAPAETIFFLGGKFKEFHAIAAAWRNATVVFQVFVDDRKAFDSGPLASGAFKPVRIPLTGVQDLRLVVTDGGNGHNGDHASWVDARISIAAGIGAAQSKPAPATPPAVNEIFAKADELRAAEKFEQAVKLYDTLIPRVKGPQNARAVFSKADCLMRLQKYADVTALLTERLRTDDAGPHWQAAMRNTLANAHAALRQYDQAAAQCRKVLALTAEHLEMRKLESRLILARSLGQTGKTAEAIEQYRKIIASPTPNQWLKGGALIGLALQYHQTGDKAKAIEILQQAAQSKELPNPLKTQAANLLETWK